MRMRVHILYGLHLEFYAVSAQTRTNKVKLNTLDIIYRNLREIISVTCGSREINTVDKYLYNFRSVER